MSEEANRINEKTKIEQFYQKMFQLVKDSYEPSIASPNVSDTEESKHIGALRENLNFWLDADKTFALLGGVVEENTRRTEILEKIKLTLESLRDFVEHSGIFPAEERKGDDSSYQNLMRVLQTPSQPKPIVERDANIQGLLYKDFTFNNNYWAKKGAYHISIMRNLSSFLQQLLANHTDDK